MAVFNQLDREASAALIAKIKGGKPSSRALLSAAFSPRLRETEAVIVEHVVRQEAERQKRGRVKPRRRASDGLPTESQSQKALVHWWHMACGQHAIPEVLLFAVPNGGARDAITGARLKQEGARAGVADVLLTVARGGYHGLALEMKRKGNKPSPAQLAFSYAIESEGWLWVCCYSTDEAVREIEDYLSHPKPDILKD